MKLKLNKLGKALLFVTALGTAAHAVPITGGINIAAYGSVAEINKTTNTVDIITSPANGTGFNAQVTNSTLNVIGFPSFGTLGNYKDFRYDPLVVVNPIWTFAGVSFDLTQITFIDESGPGLLLAGSGLLKAGGYDNTLGTWSFSADSSGSTFSWSSTATASPSRVPDGGTSAALLGASFLGLAALSRKFRIL